MKHFEACDAKTHFSKLLSDVINGQKFIITKYGVNVAMIIPFVQKKEEIDPVNSAIRALKKLRKGTTLGKKLSIRKMRAEGRK